MATIKWETGSGGGTLGIGQGAVPAFGSLAALVFQVEACCLLNQENACSDRRDPQLSSGKREKRDVVETAALPIHLGVVDGRHCAVPAPYNFDLPVGEHSRTSCKAEGRPQDWPHPGPTGSPLHYIRGEAA